MRDPKRYENLERMVFEGVGEYGIPTLEPVDFGGDTEFIPFNFAATSKDREKKSIHFFIDDYQFIRLWNDPDRYIPMLRQFQYVFTPDFSLYTDFPKAVQIFNHYRKMKQFSKKPEPLDPTLQHRRTTTTYDRARSRRMKNFESWFYGGSK